MSVDVDSSASSSDPGESGPSGLRWLALVTVAVGAGAGWLMTGDAILTLELAGLIGALWNLHELGT